MHKIIEILKKIYELEINNGCVNERYLHHYFTKEIQNKFPIYLNDLDRSKLHPEWATSNKSRLKGGKYRKKGQKYEIDLNGSAGLLILL